MLRRFFRIGFGGCGCALVAHFIERVNVVYRDILLNDYKQLAKWENGLANEYRLMMRAKLRDLRELIFVQERETTYSLNEVEKYKKLDEYLDAWHYSLGELLANTPWMSYERDIVEEIRSVNRTMDRKAEAMKNPEEAVMLEGLMVDSFSGTGGVVGGADKTRFLYNKMIKKTRPLIVNKYDKDILDSEGFDHHPELQMLPLSMKEVRYEVYEVISKAAEKGTEIGSRGNFFFVGLGGGTGTGVISPLAEQFGKGSRGYFTLGLLGGRDDNNYLGSQQPWFRRCFNILLALNDLIATADLDGIILVDNEVLIDRLKAGGKLEKHEAVLGNRMDFNKFIKEELGRDWVEKAEIARGEIKSDGTEIYHIYDANENFAEINIDDKRQSAILKISDGQIYNLKVEKLFLFKWDDVPQNVDGGLLSFLRDDLDLKWVENAEIRKNDGGNTIRISKGGNSAEITICDDSKKATIKVRDGKTYNLKVIKVKNEAGKLEIYARKIQGRAYADKLDEELTKMIYPAFGITACEEPDSDIDWAQLKHHMKLEEQSPIFVPCYASGDLNTKDLIDDALENGKLANCEYENADKIICYVRDIRDVAGLRESLSAKFPSKDTTTADVEIIAHNAKKMDVLNAVSAKIIVFESKTSKEEESKENEVLLLMRNCNVKNTLYNRLKVAQRFVDLLVKFKDLTEEKKGKPKEKIAGEIIDNERDELIDFIEVCLFSWDDIPEKVSGKLSNFLCESLNLKWAENAEISKVDGKTIRISKGGNSSEIIIDEDKKKAILKYSDGKTHDLKLKNDKGKLNVYWELIPTDGIKEEYLFSWDKVQDDKVQDDKKEAKNKQAKDKLMKSLREFFYINWATNLKIDSKDNEIICKPAAGDHKITIKKKKGAPRIATLTIDGGKPYNLKIDYADGEQKVYESENRAVDKILEEAKSFLLPTDIGTQKRDETYEDMIKIVDKLKKVVAAAINNLDDGITPIFTEPIFDITSAVASYDEEILTLMLAMGKDTYATYRDALGGAKVDRLFNEFQRETLEDRKYVESSGDADDYILKYTGENILKALKNELDNVSIAIKKPRDLLKKIETKKFLEVVKKVEGEDISIPKLLVLSFLYTKWEDVCGWDNISGPLFSWNNVPEDDTERIMNFLKMEHRIDWAGNAKVDKHDDDKTIRLFKDENSAEIIIDDKEEKATLKITDCRTHELKVKKENGKLNIYKELEDAVKEVASSPSTVGEAAEVKKRYFFSWNSVSGVDVEKLKEFLEYDFDIGWVRNAEIPKSDDCKTIRISKDENLAEIIIDDKKEKATLKITDVQTHELKVKKENGKLNIYKGDNENEKIIEELCKDSNFNWVTNGVVIERLDNDTVSISNAKHLAEITICEKKGENKRFKQIRAGRLCASRNLTTQDIGTDDNKKEAISKELKKIPQTDAFACPKEIELDKEGLNKWRIINNTGNEKEYYVRIENEKGSLKIFEDTSLELKVKEAEDGTLKIYKRRGENFKPAEADGASKN